MTSFQSNKMLILFLVSLMTSLAEGGGRIMDEESGFHKVLNSLSPAAGSEKCLSKPNTCGWYEYPPWTWPHAGNATLLASNPGIWVIEDFFNEETLLMLDQAVSRAGDENEQFGPCNYVDELRECFHFYPNNAVTETDKFLIENIIYQLGTIWPSVAPQQLGCLYAMRAFPGSKAVELHRDVASTTTVLLYLSDGGAPLFFPNAYYQGTNEYIRVHPKRGLLVTFLNVWSDGSLNEFSYHGVEYSPPGSVERMALTFRVKYSEEEYMYGVGSQRSMHQ